MPQILLCLDQLGCVQLTFVTEKNCFVAAPGGERMLEAGSAGGQVVPLPASILLLCQHTCHAQSLHQRYPVSWQPQKLLSRDISSKLTCCLQLLPLLDSVPLHLRPAKSKLLLYKVGSRHCTFHTLIGSQLWGQPDSGELGG